MRRSIILILIATLTGLLWPSLLLSAPAKKSGTIQKEQVFRAIYPYPPASLDPHGPPDPAAWPVIMAAYNRLVTMTEGSAKPIPSLAKTIRVSPDGLKYTFHLEEGLTFSDGTVVNSEAAFFSFDRLMSSDVGRRYYPHLARFEILGPYSFRLILKRPWPPFLASLSLPQASLISPGLRQRPVSYLETKTLGSGNYVVYDWQDNTIGLQERPDLPARHKIGFAMFHYEPDPQKRYEKMIAHGAHLVIAPQLPPEGLPPQYHALNVPSFSARFLAFNNRRAYTRMQNTRRAMSFIVQDAFKDQPAKMDGPFPAGLFYNEPRSLPPPEVVASDRLTQAAVIIKEMGPPQAPLAMVIRAGDKSLAQDAATIIKVLKPYGFTVNLSALDGAQLRQVMETGDYDLYLDTRVADIPSADMWLGRFLDPASPVDSNPAFFKNSRAAQLIQEINATVGQPGDGPQELASLERDMALKLAELAEIANTESPYVFLYQIEHPLVVDERLLNRRPHPMWPEIWPLDSSNLTPLTFRSGANPTGRRPIETSQPPAKAPENQKMEKPVSQPTPSEALVGDPPPSQPQAEELEGQDHRPSLEDFIADPLE